MPPENTVVGIVVVAAERSSVPAEPIINCPVNVFIPEHKLAVAGQLIVPFKVVVPPTVKFVPDMLKVTVEPDSTVIAPEIVIVPAIPMVSVPATDGPTSRFGNVYAAASPAAPFVLNVVELIPEIFPAPLIVPVRLIVPVAFS